MADQLAAMNKFLQVIEPWERLLQPGYFDFPDPDEIPGDLLLPFGEFVTKHGIENAVPRIYSISGLGLGNITNEITMYVLQAFGGPNARVVVGRGRSFEPASGRNQDLYDAAARLLGSDVHYSSTIVDSHRTDSKVRVTVQDANTKINTTIIAKRLLVAIEPSRGRNIQPLDLDEDELNLFNKFRYTSRFAGVIDSKALAVNKSYVNLPANAAPNNYLSYPEVPFNARFDYLGTGHYFRVGVMGNHAVRDDNAKQLVQQSYETLLDAGDLVPGETDRNITWKAFSAHGPMYARVSREDIQAGFYKRLYEIQGRRSTWWTGAAWSAHIQTVLWKYDDVLIPKMLEGLE
ncbi:hypothetical protein JDV02_005626 [Purpureocillium takamizusanense]|nr:uncharacterized protein JDV02_005626 [Purpureocillium takamizusanense]UNI19443.1 hypothetical protein JDV02_005626 [Purpureocillium takamizusanense]